MLTPSLDLSESIIINIMLFSTNLYLRNIITSIFPKSQDKSLFMLDIHDFYQKDGIERRDGVDRIAVKNSLFLGDWMNHIIKKEILKKYANL